MKTRFAFFVLFMLLGQYIHAQKAANVRFSVKLYDFQSISLNENQASVAIDLVDKKEFLNGKTSLQPNHIAVMSSSDYQVKVSASSNLIGQNSFIPINTISIVPSSGDMGTSSKEGIEYREVNLSTGNQTIIKSNQGDLKRSFNIAYKVSGSKSFLNQPAGAYKTTITYSILPI